MKTSLFLKSLLFKRVVTTPLRALIFSIICLAPFTFSPYFCLAQGTVANTIQQVRELLESESIFSPTSQQLEDGLKQGLKEVIPECADVLLNKKLDGNSLKALLASLEANYPDRVNKAGEAAVSRMVESIGDPYTALLTRKDMEKDKLLANNGKFAGVGVELGWKGGLAVVGTIKDSPAFQAGLKSGDLITSVNGQTVKGLSFYRAGDLLAGEAGSQAEVKVMRQGNELKFNITRAQLTLPPVNGRILESGVGYIQIGYFSPSTAQETMNALKQLKSGAGGSVGGNSLKGLILDLRSNPGGNLQEGIRTAAIFRQGELVKVKRRSGIKRMVNNHSPAFNGSIVVLVNKSTASSAEIVTLALKGQPNVKVIGQKTFGKGLIQALYSLPGGYGLRVSTGIYLSRDGESINNVGITPDVEVGSEAEALDKALNVLKHG